VWREGQSLGRPCERGILSFRGELLASDYLCSLVVLVNESYG
jgi:hypothetical protein